jgi:hypothetical protein
MTESAQPHADDCRGSFEIARRRSKLLSLSKTPSIIRVLARVVAVGLAFIV